MARLRLRFDPSCSLGEEFSGIQQWWFALSPHMTSIGDVLSGIISTFHLQKGCPNGIILLMDEFALPPSESVSLLNDKDLINVKPLELRMNGLLSEKGETQVLRKIEEFEKESGGYKSEDEDIEPNVSNDLSIDYATPIAGLKRLMRTPLSKSLKRKKSAEKDGKPKTKKMKRETAVEEKESGRKKKSKTKVAKASKKKMPKQTKEQESDDDDGEDADESGEGNKEKERSHKPVPMSNGMNVIPAAENEVTENGNMIKKASRSARRKKAKREWLRSNKNALASSGNQTETVNENATTIANKSPPTPCNREFHGPVVVAPGHIRFEPLDESTEAAPLPVMSIGIGVKSKKQGQSWGQSKRGRHENGREIVEHIQKPVEACIDFNRLPLLRGTPEQGDILAYKIVELTANGTPELSTFRVGEVVSYDDSSKLIKLIAVPEHPIPKNEEDQFPDAYQEDGSLEVDFFLLAEVHVLNGQNNAPADNRTETNSGVNAGGKPGKEEEQQRDVNGESVPLSKKEKWQVKSMRAAALGPTLARLRALETNV